MDNSIGNGNDTFFINKNIIKKEQSINNTNNTKMTDVSREFGELNKDIFNALQEKSHDHSNVSFNKNNSNNNSVGNLIDECWTDKLASPDTSENFALKIENLNKKPKPISKAVKNKINKPTKTIINIPNAKFKKASDTSNIPLPNPTLNNKLGDSKQNLNKNKIANMTDLDDDTNEGIPLETDNLVNMPFKSNNKNTLSDINSKSMRMNTEDNTCSNENIYGNMKMSPIKEHTINMQRSNINNFAYRQISCDDEHNINPKSKNNFMMNGFMGQNIGMNITPMGQMIGNITNQTNNLCINPKSKYHDNISAGLSTNESNESFDSNQNKFNFGEDRYYTPGHKNINTRQYNVMNKKIDFSINLPSMMTTQDFMHPHNMNRILNPINFPNMNINNINSRNRIIDDQRSLSHCNGPEYNMPPYPHNTVNFMTPNNTFYDNIFSQNSIENGLFSFNNDNRSNMEKKKIKKQEDSDASYSINLDDIINARDQRTTIMIRHIPNKYTPSSILDEINPCFRGKYDFFYMPIDYNNECNLGYAFINFIDPLYIIYFFKVFKSRKWKRFKSPKQCDMSYGKFQGVNEIISNLENSEKNNRIPEDKKPLILIPPNPLPKIEIPTAYQDIFRKFHPNKLNKVSFLDF